MNGKVFLLLLAAFAIVVAVAVLSLFDESGAPDGGHHDAAPHAVEGTQGGAEPTAIEPANGGGGAAETVRTENTPTASTAKPRKLSVTGTVTDRADDRPIAKAKVTLYDQDGDDLESVETDASGRYALTQDGGIPPKVSVIATAEGHAAQNAEGSVVGIEHLQFDFKLSATFSIEGRITSAKDGTPVPEADVSLRSLASNAFSGGEQSAESDATGYYKIADVEDLPREGIDLVVNAPEFASMVKKDVKVDADARIVRVDFALYDNLVVRGLVLSRVTGKPIEDAEVNVVSRDPDFIDLPESESTGEDGRFEVKSASTPYEGLFVNVSAPEHAAIAIDPVPAPDAQGVIDLGTVTLGSPVKVTGIVLNARTNLPVNSGSVSFCGASAPGGNDGDYCDSADIDANGRFELQLEYTPAGKCEALVQVNDFTPLRRIVAIPADGSATDTSFKVEPMLKLHGIVRRSSDNTTVTGVRVSVLTDDESLGWEQLEGRTNAMGEYRIELPSDRDVSRFAVVLKYGALRFPAGEVGALKNGAFEIVKDITADIPKLK